MYDLIIIGGGMSGISVGHFFRDRKILLLERSGLLSEASGKNAGFIISGFGEHFRRTAARWGTGRAREIQEIHLANHRRIRELARDIACDYNPSGSLSIALDEVERADLYESCEQLRALGFKVEWTSNADTGIYGATQGMINHHDASLDQTRFWSGLAAGLPIKTGSAVRHVENENDCVIIHTISQQYRARNVVFCLNAFSADLVPELKGRYIPLRGQIVEQSLLKRPPTDMPVIADYGDIYWRFTRDRLIFGGLENLVPEEEVGVAGEPSPRIRNEQLKWIRKHFRNDLIGGKILSSRCSTMAFTVDGFPFVGTLAQPRRFVLSGLCGLGHGYAMECASWLHELISSGQNRIPAYFSSDRINNLPVYTEGDWRTLYEAWNH